MASEFVNLAKQDEIAEGQVRIYKAGGKSIALCNDNGTCYAVADLCTHDGGPLGEGELIDGEIECPRHGARFDVHTGQVTCLPAIVPIATYKVENRDGELWVELPTGA